MVSPILSNIYLHKLDEFVEQELIPQYTRGAAPEPQSRLPAGRCTGSEDAAARGPGGSPANWHRKCARSTQPTRWTPVTAV